MELAAKPADPAKETAQRAYADDVAVEVDSFSGIISHACF
jgi:hypothetical protein